MVEWEGYGNEVSFERIFDEKAYRGGGGAIYRAVKEYALEKGESRPLTLERLGSLSDSCPHFSGDETITTNFSEEGSLCVINLSDKQMSPARLNDAFKRKSQGFCVMGHSILKEKAMSVLFDSGQHFLSLVCWKNYKLVVLTPFRANVNNLR